VRARTRIICTVAPPSARGGRARDAEDYVSGMIAAGMDVARVNLSHSRGAAHFAGGHTPDYEVEEALLERIRAAAAEDGPERHVAILLDLQGIKIRMHLPRAVRESGAPVTAGSELRVRFTQLPAPGEVSCDAAPEVLDALRQRLETHGPVQVAVADGDIFLRLERVEDECAILSVPEDCLLEEGKGLTFRGVALPHLPALTQKDRVDLAVFAIPAILSGAADVLALSFTRSAADVWRLRDFCNSAVEWFRQKEPPRDPQDAALLQRLLALRPDLVERYAAGDPHFHVLAKIETPLGVQNMGEIIEAVDAVMVARGDLGLSCAAEDVPRYQKEILAIARARGRPAVVATQMLQSMVTDPEPRRPEAADVFNAVLDGADALMLSNETATGSRPHEAVETLHRIALAAEKYELGMGGRALALRKSHDETQRLREVLYRQHDWLRVTDQLTFEAVRLADDLRAAAIVGATRSGRTVFNLARYRSRVPVIALVPDAHVARRLATVRSVQAVVSAKEGGEEGEVDFERGLAKALELGLLSSGDLVVVVSARPGDPAGATSVLEVRPIG